MGRTGNQRTAGGGVLLPQGLKPGQPVHGQQPRPATLERGFFCRISGSGWP